MMMNFKNALEETTMVNGFFWFTIQFRKTLPMAPTYCGSVS